MDIQPTASANNPLQKQKQATTDLLLEQAGLGIGYYDIDGMALLFNAVAAAHLDGLPEDFVGKSIGELFDPATASIYLDRIKMAANSESSQVYEDWVTFPSGKICFLSTFSRVKDLSDEVIGVQIVSQDITDRKQMEEALSQSEERLRKSELNYRELVENANTIILRMDAQGIISYFNEFAQRFFGYTQEEILDRNVVGTIVPEQETTGRELANIMTEAYQHPDRYYEYENENIRRNGERVWIAWRNRPLLDQSGQVTGWLCVGGDITERKQMEAAVRASEEKYRLLAENTEDVIWTMTEKLDRFSYVSPSITRLLGYTPEEMMQMSMADFLTPASYKQTRAAIENRLKVEEKGGGDDVTRRWEVEYIRKDGSIIWVESTTRPFRDAEARFKGLVGVTRDITERKRGEIAVHQREQEFRSLAENMPDIVARFDRQLRHIYVNHRIEEVTGLPVSAFLGKTSREMGMSESLVTYWDEKLVQLFETGQVDQLEYTFPSPTGTRYFESRLIPEFGPDGSVETVLGINRDITEQKQAEAALRQTNAELSRRVEELSALNQIAQAMATMTDLPAALEMVSQTMTRLFGAYGTGIGLLTEDRSALRVFTHAPRDKSFPSKAGRLFPIAGNSLVQTVIKKAETVCLYQIQTDPDLAYLREALQAPDVTGLMSLPLLSYGKVIGTITVTTDQTDRRFRPVEVQLAKTVAGTVANAVENARLFQAEQRQRQIAESLQEVAMILNSTLDTETILAKIFEQLGRVIPHHGGGLLLRDRNCLVLTKAIGEPAKSHLGDKILLNSQHPVARVFKAKQMMIINDGGKEPHWWAPDVIRSWIGAPLCIGQKAIGVLTVDNFAETDAYREEEGQILQIFANQAATAIENARLYEQVQQDAHTKAVLLQEVNHRVKNNLMGISGMLYATRRYAEQSGIQEPCLDLIKDLAYRIDGLATVHNMLANAEWSRLSLHRLTAEIIEVALQALPPGKETFPRIISANPVWITPRQANSLAMIINELTTNTLKYALNERQSAQITVHIAQRDEINLFEFRDDGPGYSEEVLRLEGHNVGMYLIRNLVQSNLNGQVELQNDNGAAIYIRFPAEI